MIKLNRYQRLAYDNPTIEGQHATHMPDGWLVHNETIDEQAVTVGITVDVAAENRAHYGTDAVWMISVSIWPTSMAESSLTRRRYPSKSRSGLSGTRRSPPGPTGQTSKV